ncbi:uncharacterized protein M6B38_306720 [Iris pallida]|uniref:PB1 domain-containing protein n=1 Tax=Iris pallida TaxID=29817 RepID=A0AAX6HLJ9_IRIPA|nr:uncharacterized protein M6B38_306720 [Iris pallida]
MTQTPSSSSSLDSFEDVSVNKIKFLCSYSGKILPRPSDGKLRYVGGETRVLAVDRCTSFSELQLKMKQLCGWSRVSLRCQLPAEDLDALVSVTCDEDLSNLVEEYQAAGSLPLKIRAFLHDPRPLRANSSAVARHPPGPMVHGRYAAPCYRYHHHRHQYLVHHGNLQVHET